MHIWYRETAMRGDDRESAGDALITLWQRAVRLHREMSLAYDRIGETRRECSGDDAALLAAQARADALGQRYERLCERICRSEPRTLDGLLAKLRCATRCIRDTVPEGRDPERFCDIELRFVFALERDVARLMAESRRRGGKGPLGMIQKMALTESRSEERS
jgi:hypothetical protein